MPLQIVRHSRRGRGGTVGSSLSRASVIRVNAQTVELYCGIALPSGKTLSSARRAWISAFLRLDPSTKNRRRRIAGAEVEAASKLTTGKKPAPAKTIYLIRGTLFRGQGAPGLIAVVAMAIRSVRRREN
jgi:hypothetical protein